MRVLLLHPTYSGRCLLMLGHTQSWRSVCDAEPATSDQRPYLCEMRCDSGHTFMDAALNLYQNDHWVIACSSVCCLPECVTKRVNKVEHSHLSSVEKSYMESRFAEHKQVQIFAHVFAGEQ